MGYVRCKDNKTSRCNLNRKTYIIIIIIHHCHPPLVHQADVQPKRMTPRCKQVSADNCQLSWSLCFPSFSQNLQHRRMVTRNMLKNPPESIWEKHSITKRLETSRRKKHSRFENTKREKHRMFCLATADGPEQQQQLHPLLTCLHSSHACARSSIP